MNTVFLITSAISGFIVVALGAFGAHGLRDVLEAYGKSIWEKAVLYQMFHTVALLAVGFLQKYFEHLNLGPVAWAFIAGIVLFSGSLYLMALTQIRWLGAITPIGGLAFLFGWLWLTIQLAK